MVREHLGCAFDVDVDEHLTLKDTELRDRHASSIRITVMAVTELPTLNGRLLRAIEDAVMNGLEPGNAAATSVPELSDNQRSELLYRMYEAGWIEGTFIESGGGILAVAVPMRLTMIGHQQLATLAVSYTHLRA